jgi:hypothetical protein
MTQWRITFTLARLGTTRAKTTYGRHSRVWDEKEMHKKGMW